MTAIIGLSTATKSNHENEKTEEISGSKIVDFSQICELNIVEKNTCVGKDNVMMAGFKDMQIEKYIKKIQSPATTRRTPTPPRSRAPSGCAT